MYACTVYIHLSLYMYIYIYICMCTYVYMCVYIYIYVVYTYVNVKQHKQLLARFPRWNTRPLNIWASWRSSALVGRSSNQRLS